MDKINKNVKVVIAMSGGVDSSVSAALLKQAGFDVVGIMMKFWNDPEGTSVSKENRCCSIESEKLARLVAKKIGIPFYVLNVEKEFKRKVVDYFLKEYKKGNTPNPCVVCNKEIKFGFLIKKALTLGADFIATGHYATIRDGKLFKSKYEAKDQSYFLWQLSQKQLSHVLFPVGGYTKPEVRRLAKKFKLPTAETPESQEVCFIKDTTNNFLKKYLKTNPGKITDLLGKPMGMHNGLWFYTIGQRRGLEIPQGPYYVIDKDFKKNILIVSKNQKDLNKKELIAYNVNWITTQKLSRQSRGSSTVSPSGPINAEIKIRYKSKISKAKIFLHKNKNVKVVFEKPQRAITPGQSVVFYKKGEVLGGGTIL